MFQFANRARVIAGIVAVTGTAGTASAGDITPAGFTTMHAASMQWSYFGSANGVLDAGSGQFDYNGPSTNALEVEHLFGTVSQGRAVYELATWLDGVDSISVSAGSQNWQYVGVWAASCTLDVEFNNAMGGVMVDWMTYGDTSSQWTITDALGATTTLSVGDVVANGRYTLSFSGVQTQPTPGAFLTGFNMYIDVVGASVVPAPGAIALLGLAGLAGRRRR